MSLTVLVTDPEQRAALAAVRALGARGHRVFVLGRSKGLAGHSRFVRSTRTVSAEVLCDPARYVDTVAQEVRDRQAQVVLPVTDNASRSLLGHDDRIGAVVAGPSRSAYLRASDKAALLEAAPACGIRVPRQLTLQRPGDSCEAADAFGQVVVKPAQSVVEVDGRTVSTRVQFVGEGERVAEVVRRFPAAAYPLLLQERVRGDGVGVFLLRRDGRTLLQFGHRRLREKPPAGGVSTYREVYLPPDALRHACERLLDSLGYEGAAMIEFKRDEVTGECVLMEINARLWGSVQLAIDAGLDFPSALVDMAMGRPTVPPDRVRTEVRSVWEFGEIDHMLALLRHSRDTLHLPPSAPIGLRGAVGVLFDRRLGDRPEVFRFTDPRPFGAEAVRWLRRQS